MPDDPREILQAAGAECPEVSSSIFNGGWFSEPEHVPCDAAILALARLVAKYKWQRDAVLDRYVMTVEGEWGISHWKDNDVQPTGDDGWLTDTEAREKWKARVVNDLGKDEWDELNDD